MPSESEVIAREKKKHDERFADDSLRKSKVGRYYKIANSIRKEYYEQLKRFCVNGRVLEFGCGTDAVAAFALTEKAIEITAIDISTVAVQKAKELALDRKLSNVRFFEMNAEELDFDEKFDLICGSGILHHLNLRSALGEIKRVLKPGGHAVFIEPLGHNPFINLYRKLTPAIRSEDEHPLLAEDLKTIKNFFPEVEMHYYYLTSLLAAFFSGTMIFNPLLRILEKIDAVLFKLPGVRNWSWQVLLVMRG